MKRTYIASPLGNKDPRGIEANMEACRQFKLYAAENMGVEACALHDTLPKFPDDNIPEQREAAMKQTTELLLTCEQVFLCGNTLSKGMLAEATTAYENGLIIKTFHPFVSDALTKAGIKHVLVENEFLSRSSLLVGGYRKGGERR